MTEQYLDSMRKLSAWKPSSFAGFKIGDLAELPTLGRVEVLELLPPSMIRVRTANGGECKCGWRILRKVLQ